MFDKCYLITEWKVFYIDPVLIVNIIFLLTMIRKYRNISSFRPIARSYCTSRDFIRCFSVCAVNCVFIQKVKNTASLSHEERYIPGCECHSAIILFKVSIC